MIREGLVGVEGAALDVVEIVERSADIDGGRLVGIDLGVAAGDQPAALEKFELGLAVNLPGGFIVDEGIVALRIGARSEAR